MLQKLIKNFYFSEKEAKVYLAALELGRSKVSRIAKKAGLNRVTAYEVLKRLVEMGIAQSAFYGGVKTFTVLDPEKLIEKMEHRLSLAKTSLPELSLLMTSKKQKPNIGFYEGKEGFSTIYEDSLSCQEKIIFNIANPQNLFKNIEEDFFDLYVSKRRDKKIKAQVLLPDLPENKKYQGEEEEKSLREVKFFEHDKYPFSNEIIIYDNKVALLSFDSLIGVIIEDKDIALSVKSLWKMVWDKTE